MVSGGATAGAASSETSVVEKIALGAIFDAQGDDSTVRDAVVGLQTLVDGKDDGERKIDSGYGDDFEGQRARDEEVVRSYFVRSFASAAT